MTPICAVDTETTSLRPDRRAWDIALIRRDDEGERRVQFFIELDALDLPNADPFSLNVGRFWERHPQAMRLRAGQDIGCDAVELWSSWAKADVFAVPEGAVVDAATAAHVIAGMTHGAHLVGAVPNFDAEVLAALLRDNGLTPSFHYHLIDVEALAVGWLCAWDRADGEPGIRPPWRSDDLSTALGVPPPAKDTRHTALGDAAWALAIYDHITGGEEKP